MNKIPQLPPLPKNDEPTDHEKLVRLANLIWGLREEEVTEEIEHRLTDALKEASIVGPTWGDWDLPLDSDFTNPGDCTMIKKGDK